MKWAESLEIYDITEVTWAQFLKKPTSYGLPWPFTRVLKCSYVVLFVEVKKVCRPLKPPTNLPAPHAHTHLPSPPQCGDMAVLRCHNADNILSM